MEKNEGEGGEGQTGGKQGKWGEVGRSGRGRGLGRGRDESGKREGGGVRYTQQTGDPSDIMVATMSGKREGGAE